MKSIILALALATAALNTGCTSMGRAMSSNYEELGGKVLRLRVYDFGYGKVETMETARKRVDGLMWLKIYDNPPASSDRILPYRWVHVVAPGAWEAGSFWANGAQGWVPAMVSDSVPPLHEGDWVDVYVPNPPLSVKKHHWLTVIKLVCTHDDKDCQRTDPVGKAKGQVVPGPRPAPESISFTKRYGENGEWLPGMIPARP